MNLDLKSIVLYLHKKKMPPTQITKDINETLGQGSISYSTVTRHIRLQLFPSEEKHDKNTNKNHSQEDKIKAVAETLKDFPFFSVRQIAAHLKLPQTSVYRILTEKLRYKIKNLRWIPHILNSSQKVQRVEYSRSLQKTLAKAKKSNYKFFYTGDESWFYLCTDHTFQWLPLEEPPAKREKLTILSKKYMLTVFWNPNGFALVKVLPDDMTFNAQYFIDDILTELHKKAKATPNNDHQKLTLHYDNARPHTARKVTNFLEEHNMKKAPHPPYSPDIAPSDFYLFGYLKSKLQGQRFASVDSLLDKVYEILDDIPTQTLKDVFEEWERRLQFVINNKGEYID